MTVESTTSQVRCNGKGSTERRLDRLTTAAQQHLCTRSSELPFPSRKTNAANAARPLPAKRSGHVVTFQGSPGDTGVSSEAYHEPGTLLASAGAAAATYDAAMLAQAAADNAHANDKLGQLLSSTPARMG